MASCIQGGVYSTSLNNSMQVKIGLPMADQKDFFAQSVSTNLAANIKGFRKRSEMFRFTVLPIEKVTE